MVEKAVDKKKIFETAYQIIHHPEGRYRKGLRSFPQTPLFFRWGLVNTGLRELSTGACGYQIVHGNRSRSAVSLPSLTRCFTLLPGRRNGRKSFHSINEIRQTIRPDQGGRSNEQKEKLKLKLPTGSLVYINANEFPIVDTKGDVEKIMLLATIIDG